MKAWISAARLRTLPLSVSGIIVGAAMAGAKGAFDWRIFVLALLTTIGFQVVSNFANDYGDGVKGTDNDDRVGPARALQTGAITPKAMKRAIIITSVITMLVALLLVYISFGKDSIGYILLFLLLGIASIAAAIKYTVGSSAYGYHGFGDLFVFLFFGLLSVCGSYFLFTKQLSWEVFLPAFSIGCLSAGVLNLNNMRDRESDEKVGKNTLVVKIGDEFAKYYHYYLLVSAMFFSLLFVVIKYKEPLNLIFLLAFIPILWHLKTVYNNKDPKKLDPELKKLALSTFIFSFLFYISQNLFL